MYYVSHTFISNPSIFMSEVKPYSSDPCWYYVANATGKEIIIFDLYPNTGERFL